MKINYSEKAYTVYLISYKDQYSLKFLVPPHTAAKPPKVFGARPETDLTSRNSMAQIAVCG